MNDSPIAVEHEMCGVPKWNTATKDSTLNAIYVKTLTGRTLILNAKRY